MLELWRSDTQGHWGTGARNNSDIEQFFDKPVQPNPFDDTARSKVNNLNTAPSFTIPSTNIPIEFQILKSTVSGSDTVAIA